MKIKTLLNLAGLLLCASGSIFSQSNSYNLPLEIAEIALNSRLSQDGGTDAPELWSGYNTTGRSGRGGLAGGSVSNNGLDVAIHLGWYTSAFGNEPVLMRLFFLKPSPQVYSPEGIHLDSRFSTRILSREDTDTDGNIDSVKILRTNGMIIEYRLDDGSTTRFSPSEQYQSYPTYLDKIAENEYWRCDDLGNKLIYKLNTLADPSDDEVWYRNRMGNTITSSSEGIDVEVIHKDLDEMKYLRQILTAQTLVDIDDSDLLNENYTLKFYKANQAGPKDGNGYYTIASGTPFAEWKVENPDTSAGDYNKVKITKTIYHSGGSNSYTYQYEHNTNDGWTLVKAGGDKTEHMKKYPDVNSDGIFNEWVVPDANGNTLKNYTELVTPFQWGDAVSERIIRTGGAEGEELTQKLDYFNDPSELGSYGRLKTIENPDGSWLRFEYDDEGRIIFQHRPFENSQVNETVNVTTTEYDYTPHTGDNATDLTAVARTVISKVAGQITAKLFHVYDIQATEATHITERAHSITASYGDGLNQRVVTKYYGGDASIPEVKRSQKKSVLYPNGRMDTFDYSKDVNDHIFTTVTQGTSTSPGGIPYKTTRSVVEVDDKGNQVGVKVYICIGQDQYSASPIAEVTQEYDDLSNLIKTYKNGRLVYEAIYEGNKLIEAIGEDGVKYQYSYDTLERLTDVLKVGAPEYNGYALQATVITQSVYNAASQRITQTVGALNTGGQITSSLTNEYGYDLAGRVNYMKNPGDYETSVEYSNGGRTVKTSKSDGTMSETYRRLDGSIEKEIGCCIVDKFYEFFVDDNGYRGSKKTIVSETSPRWSQSITDLLGRTVETESPAFGGGTNKSNYFYNDQGQLEKTTSPGRGDVLYEYDELGRAVRQGLDVDGNGSLDLASDDVISEGDSYFEYDSTEQAWYRVSKSMTYVQSGSAMKTELGLAKVRLSNFSTGGTHGDLVSESISIDIHGNESTTRVYVDRANRVTTQIAEVPHSPNDPKAIYYNGKLVRSYGANHDMPTIYTYDGLGRPVKVQVPFGRDAQSNPIYKEQSTLYDPLTGFVWKKIDMAGKETTYEYFGPGTQNAGRLKSVTGPDGKKNYMDYTSKGQPYRTWGDGAIPIENTYDDYGQLVSFTTYRGGTGWNAPNWPTSPGTGDTTEFAYDTNTGLMLWREDAADVRTTFDYTAFGQMTTFTNARGQTATFDYDPVKAQLESVSYSEANTPGVDYDYDRIGRITGINDGVFGYAMTYNTETMQFEKMEMDGLGTMAMDKTFTAQYETDAEGLAGRPKGWSLSDTTTTAEDFAMEYGYDTLGRLESIRSSHTAGASDKYVYNYTPDTNFVESIQYQLPSQDTLVTASYTYTSDRYQVNTLTNTIDGDTQSPGTTELSKFTYGHDADTGMIDTVTHEGDAYATDYFTEYSYGERYQMTDATNYNGTDTSNKTSPRTNEAWNYSYDTMGNRLSSTEGGGSQVTYTTNALNQYTAISGYGTLTYDADGNMDGDAEWSYEYDVLNRLIGMTPKVIAPGKNKMEFTYDYMSRRVRKKVYTYSPTLVAELSSDEKYVYSGWSLVAVYDGQASDALLRTYTWGADGGSGGIGGLISVEEHSGTHQGKYLYLYDATGNVTQIVKASDGTVVAKYEYDPYGKTRISVGSYASANPFRYQTKYTDDESGLIYYGYRFYSHVMGRFINRDPIGERGGLNLYAFVANDPINKREYLGLAVLGEGMHDEYIWWREGLGTTNDGNSNWRKILTKAYTMYYNEWSHNQRHDFQMSTVAAYHSVENKADEVALDISVGGAVDDAVARLTRSANSTVPTNPTQNTDEVIVDLDEYEIDAGERIVTYTNTDNDGCTYTVTYVVEYTTYSSGRTIYNKFNKVDESYVCPKSERRSDGDDDATPSSGRNRDPIGDDRESRKQRCDLHYEGLTRSREGKATSRNVIVMLQNELDRFNEDVWSGFIEDLGAAALDTGLNAVDDALALVFPSAALALHSAEFLNNLEGVEITWTSAGHGVLATLAWQDTGRALTRSEYVGLTATTTVTRSAGVYAFFATLTIDGIQELDSRREGGIASIFTYPGMLRWYNIRLRAARATENAWQEGIDWEKQNLTNDGCEEFGYSW